MLTHQIENVQLATDEDTKLFFASVDGLTNILKSVVVTKEEREITRIIICNLPDNYDVGKRGILLKNTGFYKLGMDFKLGIDARRIKIFVSAPNLRTNVSILHLLLAIENFYTPYKFAPRKPKRWGPR